LRGNSTEKALVGEFTILSVVIKVNLGVYAKKPIGFLIVSALVISSPFRQPLKVVFMNWMELSGKEN
jgi:hypothetical protein